MSAPDPEGVSMLAKVVAAGAAILTPLGALWLWIDNRFAKKHAITDIKQTHLTANDAIWKEMDRRRDIEAKLFDQMREHETQDRDRFERQEAASRDRHDEIMQVIGDLRTDVAKIAGQVEP